MRTHKLMFEVLGALEAEIMPILWRDGRATVREVYLEIMQRRPIAYTTVMTTTARLAEKGLLHCDRDGMTYIYTPLIGPLELAALAARHVADELLEGDVRSLVAVLSTT